MEVKAETLTVHGMPGHWHTSLELPDGALEVIRG